MDRIILHSDLNNFFASVECLYHPELREKPIAVCGDIELRHGIVLAKNTIAKSYGVRTGETLSAARDKCPEFVFTEPHYDRYLEYSRLAREIYEDYTDHIESFGIDECWLDVSCCRYLYRSGREIADSIRERIREELGVTASVGVSYNKIFAKMGSDYKKPDATTVITRGNFRRMLWQLPVSDLLFVGQSTFRTLRLYGITALGDLANADVKILSGLLGKTGVMLWQFANGLDTSPVALSSDPGVIKSVGNSTTAPRDLTCDEDVRIIMYVLCESVSSRLRALNRKCRTVQISLRDTALSVVQRQMKLKTPILTERDLFDVAFALYLELRTAGKPLRSVGVRACELIMAEQEQVSLFPSPAGRQERLEESLDHLRKRFGSKSVVRGVLLTDRTLSDFCPREEHQIHPEVMLRA